MKCEHRDYKLWIRWFSLRPVNPQLIPNPRYEVLGRIGRKHGNKMLIDNDLKLHEPN